MASVPTPASPARHQPAACRWRFPGRSRRPEPRSPRPRRRRRSGHLLRRMGVGSSISSTPDRSSDAQPPTRPAAARPAITSPNSMNELQEAAHRPDVNTGEDGAQHPLELWRIADLLDEGGTRAGDQQAEDGQAHPHHRPVATRSLVARATSGRSAPAARREGAVREWRSWRPGPDVRRLPHRSRASRSRRPRPGPARPSRTGWPAGCGRRSAEPRQVGERCHFRDGRPDSRPAGTRPASLRRRARPPIHDRRMEPARRPAIPPPATSARARRRTRRPTVP